MMAIIDSRVRKGALSFKLVDDDTSTCDVSCQATAISIEPSFNSAGDALEVLCGDQLPEATVTSYALNFTGIQDFDNAEGFIQWALTNDGLRAEYAWKPNDGTTWTGKALTGTCTVQALTIGGDVAARNTSDAAWPCTKPVISTTT